MTFGSFINNATNKLFVYKSYVLNIYLYREIDVKGLMFHKTQANHITIKGCYTLNQITLFNQMISNEWNYFYWQYLNYFTCFQTELILFEYNWKN